MVSNKKFRRCCLASYNINMHKIHNCLWRGPPKYIYVYVFDCKGASDLLPKNYNPGSIWTYNKNITRRIIIEKTLISFEEVFLLCSCFFYLFLIELSTRDYPPKQLCHVLKTIESIDTFFLRNYDKFSEGAQ